MSPSYCPQCLEKQRRINELEEEIIRLKAKLRYQDRTAEEGPFGSSTPSSKVPLKPSSLPERQARCGGAQVGHEGHGRCALSEAEADRVETIEAPDLCPDCGTPLESKGYERRTVQDIPPMKVQNVVWRVGHKWCPRCKHPVMARAVRALPKGLYTNRLLAHVAVQHYLHGVPIGSLVRQTGLNQGTLLKALHRLGRRMQPALEPLWAEYRQAPVKHADETRWRTDGQNGYAWLFCTPQLSLFGFRQTRSHEVVRQAFGPDPLPGVLVVDRYAAYNHARCPLQYCYAHLLRDVQDLLKTFPQDDQVRAFVEEFALLLAQAMELRTLPLSLKKFHRRAQSVKKSILAIAHREARHPAIWDIQDLFRTKANRLFHWVRDRRIPAENNLAERQLRPLVLARKISFGSQSEQGARTRETLMSVLHTLALRTPEVAQTLERALDQFAQNPTFDLARFLFPSPSSHPRP